MEPTERPFSSFVREYRPLAQGLGEWVRPVENALDRLSSVAEVDQFIEESVEELLRQTRPQTPRLGGQRSPKPRAGGWAGPPGGPRAQTTRHAVAIQVLGDPALLGFWPANSDELEPVDSAVWPASGLLAENRDEVWLLARVDEDKAPGEWGLYTFLDLTREEEGAVEAGHLDLVAIVGERRARIEPIVNRLQEQIDEFFDVTLPERVRERLTDKRAELQAREAVTTTLRFPDEWRLSAPVLEPSSDAPEQTAAALREIRVPMTARLAPVSFADLQRTIRVWTDAVERYPEAFALPEDRVSDLLAATLNATMPGAHREVYSRDGKSDIFVHADVLAEGAGPAPIFIAESKWARSSKVVREAIDPQLFGYLIASDTASVLLLLMPQNDPHAALPGYLSALRDVAGFQREEESAVAGWPLFLYRHEGRTVRVCIASVFLPN